LEDARRSESREDSVKRIQALARIAVLAAILAAAASPLPGPRTASAQSPQPGIALYPLGSQAINGTDWSFSGDFAITAGAWESVTVSNYGYCFVGPNDPRAGTAHAGAVFWFGELQAQPPQTGGYVFAGALASGRGGNSSGQTTVTTNGDPASPLTHIDLSLSGNDLSYFSGQNLGVCLLGSD
jgi:hypothetical protein